MLPDACFMVIYEYFTNLIPPSNDAYLSNHSRRCGNTEIIEHYQAISLTTWKAIKNI